MSLMANPTEALLDYQRAFDAGMPVDADEFDGCYLKRSGDVAGATRFDYVKIVDGKVQALALFVHENIYENLACYSIGYAVNKSSRGRGLALEAIKTGIDDLKKRYGEIGVEHFYLEALVDRTNIHSINVARKALADDGVLTTDSETGTPAILFRKIVKTLPQA